MSLFVSRLLFPPREGQEHPHSAFVLHAAIVKIVPGQSYPEFPTHHFFEPLDMQNTRFYVQESGFSPEQMAVGYGLSQASDPNLPINWDSTSWLIMRSGGMVSNPGDMYKWVNGIHSDKILS